MSTQRGLTAYKKQKWNQRRHSTPPPIHPKTPMYLFILSGSYELWRVDI